jgi:hypothetical protein
MDAKFDATEVAPVFRAVVSFCRRNRAIIACAFAGTMIGALLGYSEFGILSHIDQTVRLMLAGDVIGTLVGATIKDAISDRAVDNIFSALWVVLGLFCIGQIIRDLNRIVIGNWASAVGVSGYASVLFLCVARANGSVTLGRLSVALSLVPVAVFSLDGNQFTFAPAVASAAIGVYLIQVSTHVRTETRATEISDESK